MTDIKFVVKNREYSIPNTWELLNPEQFIGVCRLLSDFGAGRISIIEVKLRYVCLIMGWNPNKIKRNASWQNLYLLASQISFMFELVYPAGTLDGIPKDIRALTRKTEPDNLPNPYCRYLAKQEYQYRIDACFARLLLPEIKIRKKRYRGYSIRTEFDRITCNLTAIQFIEARQLLAEIYNSINKLPLLAAILYYPGTYSSSGAHQLATLSKFWTRYSFRQYRSTFRHLRLSCSHKLNSPFCLPARVSLCLPSVQVCSKAFIIFLRTVSAIWKKWSRWTVLLILLFSVKN